jgi:hypothetical protein
VYGEGGVHESVSEQTISMQLNQPMSSRFTEGTSVVADGEEKSHMLVLL